MPTRFWLLSALALLSVCAPKLVAQVAKPAPTLSFDRDVHPILRKRCASCHNAERARGELDLTSFAGVVAGGASGKAAVAGAPEQSPMYTQAAHLEEPHMPPNAPRIPQREVDILCGWIEQGLTERSTDSGASSASQAVATSRDRSSAGTAGGLIPPSVSPRAAAVSAIAASPIAPVAAVSGRKEVLVYDIAARRLSGALAFPEGDVFVLKFSRDGKLLLAAGGIGARSGKAVLFETSTWARVSALGDELDAVLAADLSPDKMRVALGGPSRIVKVFANPGGELLQTFRKPTDWVTAASFSPDGLLTAAGDRFGGLFLWETRLGAEFLSLRGHSRAVTSIAWLAQSDGLVTAGEDGVIQVWDLHTGKLRSRWEAHPGGVLALDVDPSGRIASVGRDRQVRVWDAESKLIIDRGPTTDHATRVSWTSDPQTLLAGDYSGEVRLWRLDQTASASLPVPVAPEPAALATVVPVLRRARPYAPSGTATAAPVLPPPTRKEATSATVGELEIALQAARTTALAAERTVASLSRLAQAQTSSTPGAASLSPPIDHPGDALAAASSALASLRAALAAEPGEAALTRAIEETERAVLLLKRKERRGSDRMSSTADR
jgi:WD40 repeat protein